MLVKVNNGQSTNIKLQKSNQAKPLKGAISRQQSEKTLNLNNTPNSNNYLISFGSDSRKKSGLRNLGYSALLATALTVPAMSKAQTTTVNVDPVAKSIENKIDSSYINLYNSFDAVSKKQFDMTDSLIVDAFANEFYKAIPGQSKSGPDSEDLTNEQFASKIYKQIPHDPSGRVQEKQVKALLNEYVYGFDGSSAIPISQKNRKLNKKIDNYVKQSPMEGEKDSLYYEKYLNNMMKTLAIPKSYKKVAALFAIRNTTLIKEEQEVKSNLKWVEDLLPEFSDDALDFDTDIAVDLSSITEDRKGEIQNMVDVFQGEAIYKTEKTCKLNIANTGLFLKENESAIKDQNEANYAFMLLIENQAYTDFIKNLSPQQETHYTAVKSYLSAYKEQTGEIIDPEDEEQMIKVLKYVKPEFKEYPLVICLIKDYVDRQKFSKNAGLE